MGGTRSSEGGNDETDRAWHLTDNYMGLHVPAHRDVPLLGPGWALPKVKSLGCYLSIRPAGCPGILLASVRLATWLLGQPEY